MNHGASCQYVISVFKWSYGTAEKLGVLCALASAPMYGFGASTRDQMAKVYISAEHEKTTGGGPGVPGPGAYPIPSLTGGTQFNSTKHNLPRYGFGSSDRSHQAKVYISNEHNRTTDYGKDGPGKHYTVDSSVGKQMISGGPSPYASGGSEGIRNGSSRSRLWPSLPTVVWP